MKNSGPQAKERGLCTKCYREPAKPNQAYCEQCCKKIREHRAGKKQKPNGPRVLESKPIPLSLSIRLRARRPPRGTVRENARGYGGTRPWTSAVYSVGDVPTSHCERESRRM